MAVVATTYLRRLIGIVLSCCCSFLGGQKTSTPFESTEREFSTRSGRPSRTCRSVACARSTRTRATETQSSTAIRECPADVPLPIMDKTRNDTVLVVAVALCSLWAGTARGQPLGKTSQPLVRSAETPLWTQNGNVIPMCWHQLLQFPNSKAASDAKAFVAQTIQDGWIRLLNLRTTWTDCPTSGNAKHVRVKLRIGDAGNNGTTLAPGMGTLSTAAERLIPPPKDPPGLLMGFPANWNQDDGTRAGFRSLILHEFGHVLGFDHEQARADGPASVPCYKNAAVPNAIKIEPADPASIMGWSYCTTASGVLTASDVSGARSVPEGATSSAPPSRCWCSCTATAPCGHSTASRAPPTRAPDGISSTRTGARKQWPVGFSTPRRRAAVQVERTIPLHRRRVPRMDPHRQEPQDEGHLGRRRRSLLSSRRRTDLEIHRWSLHG